MWARAPAALTLLMVACGVRQVDVAVPTDATYELAFAVATDRSGRPLRVLESFAIDRGTVVADGPRYYDIDLDEEQLRIVGVRREALKLEIPGYITSRSVDLTVEAPPPVPQFSSDSLTLALPSFAAVLLLTDGDEPRFVPTEDDLAVRQNLSLTVPVDREHCRGAYELTPFAATAELLPSAFAGAFLQQLERLSDDRVLGLMKSGLVMFDRSNRPDEPTLLVSFTNDMMFARTERMSVQRTGDHLVVLAVGEVKFCPDDECTEGRMWRVEIDGTTLVSVETSTSARGVDLRGVVMDGDRSIVVGERGTLWVGDADGHGLVSAPPIATIAGALDRIALTKDATAPHLVGGTDHLYLGNAFTGDWTSTRVTMPDLEKTQFSDLAVGPSLWAVTDPAGFVLRALPGEPFAPYPLEPPPSMEPCVFDGLGRAVGIGRAATLDQRVVFVSDCSALMLLEPSGCTTSIPIAGQAIEITPDALTTIHISDRWLTAGGANGAVYEYRY